VDNTVNVGVLCEDFVETFFVCDIDLIEVWPLSADELNAVQRNLGRVVEAIDNYNLVTMFEESQGRERPNVAGASV
jgi:hypothetical protein